MVKFNLGTEETETGVYRCQSDWRVEQNTQTVQRTVVWVLSPVRPQNRTILSSFLQDELKAAITKVAGLSTIESQDALVDYVLEAAGDKDQDGHLTVEEINKQ